MDAGSSVVYRLLPQLIQRRVHGIPSARRSMSWNAKTTGRCDPLEPSTPTRPSSSDSDRPYTPPPSYRHSRTFSHYDATPEPSTPERRFSSQALGPPAPPEYGQLDQSGAGIDWKYADQGMRLLDNSLQESWSATTTQSPQTFPRQLYIHACTYLLRALPSDMTAEESISIENALPQGVKDGLAPRPCNHDLAARQQLLGDGSLAGYDPHHQQHQQQQQNQQRRSVLHRFVAFVVLQAFLVANVLLPYVKLLLGHVYRLERKHRVSERVFSAGVQGVDAMGKRGLELSRRIASVNDGRVGQCANELMVWWIRGVTGGIHEGVGEGLSLVGTGAAPRRRSIARDVHEVR